MPILVGHHFTANESNRVYAGDIIYLPRKEGLNPEVDKRGQANLGYIYTPLAYTTEPDRDLKRLEMNF